MTNPIHPTHPSPVSVEFAIPQCSTVARMHQLNAMVWGEYVEESAHFGRFVGRRTGDTIELQYVHLDVESGQLLPGAATAVIVRADSSSDPIPVSSVRLTLDASAHDGFPAHVDLFPAGADALGAARFDALLAATAAHFDGEAMVDGTEFVLNSSTASVVNHQSPSRFLFREAGGIIHANYEGDTVTFGRSVGMRDGNVLHEWFVHELAATGEALIGESTSHIEMRADGQLERKEDFVLNGTPGYSVCVEV